MCVGRLLVTAFDLLPEVSISFDVNPSTTPPPLYDPHDCGHRNRQELRRPRIESHCTVSPSGCWTMGSPIWDRQALRCGLGLPIRVKEYSRSFLVSKTVVHWWRCLHGGYLLCCAHNFTDGQLKFPISSLSA